MDNNKQLNIVCVGAGHVGVPTMAVMASKCPDHKFTIVDINKNLVAKWRYGPLPFYEPGLDELISIVGQNLAFSADIEGAMSEADIIFISVDTPTKTAGEGANLACDTSRVEECARTILKSVTKDVVVVEKTTVPVGAADLLHRIFSYGSHQITVLSNPEFLAEGTAIQDLLDPARVLIGYPRSTGRAACEVLSSLYRRWVPDSKIITMDTFSSELAKLAANAFLAQRVTSINAIAEICEKTSADIDEVASGVGSDPRIGSKFLRASLGFGGSCFRKDVLSLVYIARSLGLNEVADYWHQVVKINERQQRRLVQRLLEGYLGSLKGKKVAVFGYAFKAATGDIRDTPAARVCQRLLDEGTDVCITDPEATNTPAQQTEVRNSLVTGCRSGKLSFARSPYLAANGADIVVIATEWPEYARLSWCDIYSDMKKPATIMDGRNLLSGKKMQDIGFHYLSIGRPDL